ncbi:hypothetical protein SAMN00777080_0653 [Aquiflexum balticum DSM 16537]|uniref:Uncharacterized protein n=1 Tax=Aquiflexum balticum DSM 16537 TaxID=758820 RepID=A0A1W2H0U4_9BACT|nr:hypothetical protein [Aquiflexum balticum]SMD42116.1 hypothetical protein SAMN00777080_0653 [Aquiflexum balticum DSM 16537]
MGKKSGNQRKKIIEEELISEVDYSEGFGGIPENVSLTKNIGCASDSKNKDKKIRKNDY